MTWSIHHKRRRAIDKAKTARRCNLMGPLAEGARAYRAGKDRMSNPHKGKERVAWFWGWDGAEEKEDA